MVAIAAVVLLGGVSAPVASAPAAAAHAPTQFGTWILPAGGTIPINHIVIVFQENHVYDTYFGTYCQTIGPNCDLNGTGYPAGLCVPLNPAVPTAGCQAPYLASQSQLTSPYDLIHDWQPAHEAYDNGSLDDFYLAENDQLSTFAYYNGAEIPTYWDIAQQYGIGDNFFASALSYSTPNHWYLLAGAAPAQGINQTLHRSSSTSTVLTTAMEQYLDEANDTETIANVLANTSVSWKYYDYALSTYAQAIRAQPGAGAAQSAFDFWNPLAAIASDYAPAMKSHFVASSSFFTDAAAGNLPNVSWVLPTFNQSDHPPASILNGEGWVGSIINAVEASPDWNSSAIFVTYDDYGGYYDNVPPPPLDADGLSFRAPLMVISPYAREGFISHQFTYFESLLHLVEWRYHLPSLTERDADAPLPLDYFDFNATPRAPIHIPLPGTAVYPTVWQGLGAPRAPMQLAVTPGPASATLNWSLGATGAAVTAFQITYGPASNPTQQSVREAGNLASVTLSGLVPGVTYQFRLQSITGANASAAVSAVAVPLSGTAPVPPGSPATWSPIAGVAGPQPIARSGASFVYDPADHAELLFGGLSSTGQLLGDTWEFANGEWTQLAPAHSPSARAYSAATYDSSDGYVLLFGGQTVRGAAADTWKYLGGAWTNLTATVGKAGATPAARSYASIADAPASTGVLLFGGKGATTVFGDSWRYSKGHWTNLNLKSGPAARWGAAMTYDAKDAYPVLQGGNSSTGSAYNDTWRFQSASWHLVTTPASPGPRVGATMAYDAADQYVLLFGGARSSGGLAPGTWRYVGGGWVLLSPTSSPPLLQYASAVYDTLHAGVLFGFGSNGTGVPGGAWEYGVPISVSLSFSPGFGDAPVVTTYFPAVSGGMSPYRYAWTFGDGSSVTTVDATHIFSVPGMYRTTLLVTDAAGAQASSTAYVAVGGPLTVVASADPSTPGGSVNLDSTVGGGTGPYQYAWNFGDGTGATSPLANPSYTFPAPGVYNVTVFVTDADGATANSTLMVPTDSGNFLVGISANVTGGVAPLAVALNASVGASVGPCLYAWSFGDGSVLTSNLSTAGHLYSVAGQYLITLNATNGTGQWGTTFLVISVAPPLQIHAQARPTASGTGQFLATATGGAGPYHYRWLFGDGQVSELAAPSHAFAGPGNYTVILTVTDRHGDRATVELPYVASGAATADDAATGATPPTSTPAPLPVAASGPQTSAAAGPPAPTAAARWLAAPPTRRRTAAERSARA